MLQLHGEIDPPRTDSTNTSREARFYCLATADSNWVDSIPAGIFRSFSLPGHVRCCMHLSERRR